MPPGWANEHWSDPDLELALPPDWATTDPRATIDLTSASFPPDVQRQILWLNDMATSGKTRFTATGDVPSASGLLRGGGVFVSIESGDASLAAFGDREAALDRDMYGTGTDVVRSTVELPFGEGLREAFAARSGGTRFSEVDYLFRLTDGRSLTVAFSGSDPASDPTLLAAFAARVIGTLRSGTALVPASVAPTASPLVAAPIQLGPYPHGVATGLGAAWVIDYASNLSKVDPATNRVVQTTKLRASDIGSSQLYGIAVGDGSVWVLGRSGALSFPWPSVVQRIDPTTMQVAASIPVGNDAYGIALSSGAVWVTNSRDNTVSRIDTATNRVTTIAVGSTSTGIGVFPWAIAIGEGSVWVGSDGQVSRIDPGTNRIIARIDVPGALEFLAVSPGAVWVTVPGDPGLQNGMIKRIDPATNQVVASIAVGDSPQALATGDGSLWVAMCSGTSVLRIDTTTNAFTGRAEMGWPSEYVAAGDRTVWALEASGGPGGCTTTDPGVLSQVAY